MKLHNPQTGARRIAVIRSNKREAQTLREPSLPRAWRPLKNQVFLCSPPPQYRRKLVDRQKAPVCDDLIDCIRRGGRLRDFFLIYDGSSFGFVMRRNKADAIAVFLFPIGLG
ncbi:hypothetical protein X976_4741 [Burkholderia pseudomallei MSHR7500]|nr:hypothetical protein X976_4741 [Burkholderia pseudomallei MSHR7500]